MQNHPTSRRALFALLLLPGTTRERFVFAPEAGTAVQRTWVTEHDLQLDRMVMKTGDVEQVMRPEMRLQSRQTLAVVDSFLAVADGSPPTFRRSFVTVGRTASIVMQGVEQAPASAVSSPLEGTSVVFTWVPGEGQYGRYFDAQEIDEHHLANLRADLGARAFLPAGEVEPGASWTIGPAALRDVFAHGGTIEFKAPDDSHELLTRSLRSGVGGGLDRAFGGTATGTTKVTFERVIEEEGRRIALLALDISVTFTRDQVERVREQMLRSERERRIHYEEAILVFGFEGRGELRWDLTANRAQDLRLTGRETVTYDIAERNIEDVEGENLRRQVMTMSGPLDVSFTCVPTDPREPPGPK